MASGSKPWELVDCPKGNREKTKTVKIKNKGKKAEGLIFF